MAQAKTAVAISGWPSRRYSEYDYHKTEGRAFPEGQHDTTLANFSKILALNPKFLKLKQTSA